jgi:hypothetical protein
MLTTGGRGFSFESSFSANNSSRFQLKTSSTFAHKESSFFNFISNVSTIIDAVSKSIFEFMLTIIPFFINSAINDGRAIHIFSDNSFTVRILEIVIVSHLWSIKFCFISSTFFSFFLFFDILFDLTNVSSSFSFSNLYFHLVLLSPNAQNFGFFDLSVLVSLFIWLFLFLKFFDEVEVFGSCFFVITNFLLKFGFLFVVLSVFLSEILVFLLNVFELFGFLESLFKIFTLLFDVFIFLSNGLNFCLL